VFSLMRHARHPAPSARRDRRIDRTFLRQRYRSGRKLGPILWQLHPSKKFQTNDVAAFPSSCRGAPEESVAARAEVRDQAFATPLSSSSPASTRSRLPCGFREACAHCRSPANSSMPPAANVRPGQDWLPPTLLDTWAKRARPSPVAALRMIFLPLRQIPGENAAGRVHLHDCRGQGARPRCRHGAH
jgi:hypothetical protein